MHGFAALVSALRTFLRANLLVRGTDGLGLNDMLMYGARLAPDILTGLNPIAREMTGSAAPVRSRTTLHAAVLSGRADAVRCVITSSAVLVDQSVRAALVLRACCQVAGDVRRVCAGRAGVHAICACVCVW